MREVTEAEGKHQGGAYVLHPAGREPGDEGADLPLWDGLNMVRIDSTLPGHAVCPAEDDLGRNIPDGGRDRGDGNIAENVEG